MPELPEVETIKRGLARYLADQQIAALELINRSSFKSSDADIDRFLIGQRISRVRRRAKVLLIDLSSNYTLAIHLKMTGQLVFVSEDVRFAAGHPSDSLIHRLPDRTTRVAFKFKSGAKLFFNDQRKFGWIKLLPSASVATELFAKTGPEPLAADFSWQVLRDRLKRRPRTSIKAALLDQSVVAGVGNIYADESLWGAKIHPATYVYLLSPTKINKLHSELIYILKLAIKSGGSSDRNYVNAAGEKGSYLDFARVYHRAGQPCPRCGHIIEKIRVAGRGTHICPFEQRLPKAQRK